VNVSLLGWSNVLSLIAWWILPDTIYGPAFGAVVNLTAAVIPLVFRDPLYKLFSWEKLAYVPFLAAAAAGLDIYTILTVLEVFEEEDLEDYGEEDVEEDDATADCDPDYDYYCY